MADPMTKPPQEPLISEFADDPDMADLVELFVSELPERIGTLTGAFEAGDLSTLQTMAHQLKGAAPGYGFPAIGAAAAELEGSLRGNPDATIDGIRGQVDDLVRVCRRAAASG